MLITLSIDKYSIERLSIRPYSPWVQRPAKVTSEDAWWAIGAEGAWHQSLLNDHRGSPISGWEMGGQPSPPTYVTNAREVTLLGTAGKALWFLADVLPCAITPHLLPRHTDTGMARSRNTGRTAGQRRRRWPAVRPVIQQSFCSGWAWFRSSPPVTSSLSAEPYHRLADITTEMPSGHIYNWWLVHLYSLMLDYTGSVTVRRRGHTWMNAFRLTRTTTGQTTKSPATVKIYTSQVI